MTYFNWLQLIALLITPVYHLASGDNNSRSDETELLKTLMRDYDKRARPVLNGSHQVEVSLSMKMLTLQEVNTRDQYISVIGWINVRWKEERFGWNATQYNLKTISIPATDVWLPTFVLSNSLDTTFYNELWYSHYKVKVWPDGNTSWNPGGTFKTHCTIDITYFPFDDQVCEFLFENWIYYSYDVNLTYPYYAESTFDVNPGAEHEQWEYTGIKVHREDSAYQNNIPYPKVYFRIHLKRKPLYYIYSFILQNVFMNGLVLSIFKLPAESGERVSMGVTIFLAITVLLLYIADSIPTASTSIPIINYYLIFVITLTSLAVIETVVVLYLFDHKANHPPPKWLQKINDCFLEPCLSFFCSKCEHSNTPSTTGINDQQTSNNLPNQNHSGNPVVFVNDGFNDINDNEDERISQHRDETLNSGKNQGTRNGDLLTVRSSTLLRHSGGAYLVSSRNSQLIAENSDEGENIAIWRHISRNIDRFCFRLFSVMFILIILISLILVPYGHVNKSL